MSTSKNPLPGSKDPLPDAVSPPSVDDLLTASDWAGRLADARARRSEALARSGRGHRARTPGEPWEGPGAIPEGPRLIDEFSDPLPQRRAAAADRLDAAPAGAKRRRSAVVVPVAAWVRPKDAADPAQEAGATEPDVSPDAVGAPRRETDAAKALNQAMAERRARRARARSVLAGAGGAAALADGSGEVAPGLRGEAAEAEAQHPAEFAEPARRAGKRRRGLLFASVAVPVLALAGWAVLTERADFGLSRQQPTEATALAPRSESRERSDSPAVASDRAAPTTSVAAGRETAQEPEEVAAVLVPGGEGGPSPLTRSVSPAQPAIADAEATPISPPAEDGTSDLARRPAEALAPPTPAGEARDAAALAPRVATAAGDVLAVAQPEGAALGRSPSAETVPGSKRVSGRPAAVAPIDTAPAETRGAVRPSPSMLATRSDAPVSDGAAPRAVAAIGVGEETPPRDPRLAVPQADRFPRSVPSRGAAAAAITSAMPLRADVDSDLGVAPALRPDAEPRFARGVAALSEPSSDPVATLDAAAAGRVAVGGGSAAVPELPTEIGPRGTVPAAAAALTHAAAGPILADLVLPEGRPAASAVQPERPILASDAPLDAVAPAPLHDPGSAPTPDHRPLAARGTARPAASLPDAVASAALGPSQSSPADPAVPGVEELERLLRLDDAPGAVAPEAVIDSGTIRPDARPVSSPEAAALYDAFAGVVVWVHGPQSVGVAGIDEAAQALEDQGIETATASPVGFAVSRDQLRYFHASDRGAAEEIATLTGAALRDFTDYRPLPPEGTLELWLKGIPSAAPAGPLPKATATSPSVTPTAVPPTGTRMPAFVPDVVLVQRSGGLFSNLFGRVRARAGRGDTNYGQAVRGSTAGGVTGTGSNLPGGGTGTTSGPVSSGGGSTTPAGSDPGSTGAPSGGNSAPSSADGSGAGAPSGGSGSVGSSAGSDTGSGAGGTTGGGGATGGKAGGHDKDKGGKGNSDKGGGKDKSKDKSGGKEKGGKGKGAG